MQKRSFLVVTMFLVGMFLTGIYAQTITVSGNVTSKEMSDPLIGVNVLVKGTTDQRKNLRDSYITHKF